MMTSKQKNSVLLAYIIVLAVFCVLFLVIPFPGTATVWTAFIFAEASVIVGYFITNRALDKPKLRSKVYGLPMLWLSYTYTVTQIAFSIIIFIASKFADIRVWVVVLVSLLLLAAVLIGTIAADNAGDIIEGIDDKAVQKIKQVKEFRVNADSLVSACTDKETKKLLEQLAEKIKYSDPVSSPSLEGIEYKIACGIDELRQMISSGKYEDMAAKIAEVGTLVDDRNRQCKAEKGR